MLPLESDHRETDRSDNLREARQRERDQLRAALREERTDHATAQSVSDKHSTTDRKAATDEPPEIKSSIERVGNPEGLAQYWLEQKTEYDCAVTSQEAVMKAFGKDVPTEAIREVGRQKGVYTDSSSIPEENGSTDIGFAFEEAGLGHQEYWGNLNDPHVAEQSVNHLGTELKAGHAVIAEVDTNPLWGKQGGHALWVTGIDRDVQGNLVTVYTNDSGSSPGAAKAYPGDKFLDAWQGGRGFHMVSTTISLPR